jgi:hypothetical protein
MCFLYVFICTAQEKYPGKKCKLLNRIQFTVQKVQKFRLEMDVNGILRNNLKKFFGLQVSLLGARRDHLAPGFSSHHTTTNLRHHGPSPLSYPDPFGVT